MFLGRKTLIVVCCVALAVSLFSFSSIRTLTEKQELAPQMPALAPFANLNYSVASEPSLTFPLSGGTQDINITITTGTYGRIFHGNPLELSLKVTPVAAPETQFPAVNTRFSPITVLRIPTPFGVTFYRSTLSIAISPSTNPCVFWLAITASGDGTDGGTYVQINISPVSKNVPPP
jgi:hypothetical protein